MDNRNPRTGTLHHLRRPVSGRQEPCDNNHDSICADTTQHGEEERVNGMDEIIKKIADYYGYESQMDMLCEECGEFVQARNKLRRSVPGAYENCLEEIADIAIMVEQMKLICGADRINEIIAQKLTRQLQRISKEQEDEP